MGRGMDSGQRARPELSLIAALSENRVIARDGGIPWDLPGDARRYRALIAGRVIIAGRKTFDRTYTNNLSIVVTRQEEVCPADPGHRRPFHRRRGAGRARDAGGGARG